jgi:hypothetical protein
MENVILFKFALGLISCTAGVVLSAYLRRTGKWLGPGACWLLLAGTHLGVFCFLFLFLGLPVSSDITVYYPEAKAVLQGHLPYRDFDSPYAPLFPYAVAGIISVWSSPKSIVLFAIILELICFPIWWRVSNAVFGRKITSFASVLYLASPVPLVIVAVTGQIQVWVFFLLGTALVLLLVRRCFWSGMVFSIACVATKFLSLLFVPPLVWTTKSRVRWVIGFAIAPILVYGALLYHGIDGLYPLRVEGANLTSGNLPFLLRLVAPAIPVRAFDLITAVALLSALAWLAPSFRTQNNFRSAIFALSLLLLVLLIFSKKAFTNYLVMAFFPLCVTAACAGEKRPVITNLIFSLFGLVALLEPSLWFRWLHKHELRICLSDPSISRIHIFLFLGCELLLLGGYVYYSIQAIRLARQPITSVGVTIFQDESAQNEDK